MAPVTSPPVAAKDLDLTKAADADIVYLNLHGFEGQPHYYGQRDGTIGPTALTAEQALRHKWRGVTVFAEVCYSAANGGGPIARAFLSRGAAFVGSTTEAYGRLRMTWWDGEADRLMWLFRHAHDREPDPAKALTIAKRWLHITSWPLDDDDRATLRSFVCLTRD